MFGRGFGLGRQQSRYGGVDGRLIVRSWFDRGVIAKLMIVEIDATSWSNSAGQIASLEKMGR